MSTTAPLEILALCVLLYAWFAAAMSETGPVPQFDTGGPPTIVQPNPWVPALTGLIMVLPIAVGIGAAVAGRVRFLLFQVCLFTLLGILLYVGSPHVPATNPATPIGPLSPNYNPCYSGSGTCN